MNKPLKPAIKLQCEHVKRVFSKVDRTFGMERLLRIFLTLSAFFYPTLYIRHISGKLGVIWLKTAVEIFVIFKVLLSGYLLAYTNHGFWIGILAAYLVSETVIYLLAIIILSDIYSPPISKGRSFILLFLNYIEINIGFSIFYLCLGGVKDLSGKIDALYFSFVSFTTLGYGDRYPLVWETKLVVIAQLMVMLLFVFLFFINLTPEMKNANTYKASGCQETKRV